MKTILPKKIKRTLDHCFTDYSVWRFITETNSGGTVYIYVIVRDKEGAFFAAWNSLDLFNVIDIQQFYSYDDARAFINNVLTIG